MTSAELAVLGLIVQEPRYGYQIEQIIEARGMRDWAEISFSSIYYVLGRLEEKDWVASLTGGPRSDGPPRKVYRVTPKGVRAWREATLETLSAPRRHSTPLLLGLANLPSLRPGQGAESLRLYAQRLRERLQYVRKNWAAARAKGPLPWHAEAMFDLSVTMARAEEAWVRKLIRQMKMREKGQSHATPTTRF